MRRRRTNQTASLLDRGEDTVHRLVERRELLAVPLPDGGYGVPSLQFATSGKVRRGVREVARAGAGIDSWTVLSILVDDAPADAGLLLERLDRPAVLRDVLHRPSTYGEHPAA